MSDDLTPWATWGLLGAWVVHDLEEAATMSRWAREARHRFPEPLRSALDIGPAHAWIAVGSMGVVMAVASADGARTGGRSGLYQAALLGFGLHALSHLGGSVAYRGYTPGVVTTPLVVVPFSVWAWRELGRAGVPRKTGRAAKLGLAALPLTILGSHAIARRLTRRKVS